MEWIELLKQTPKFFPRLEVLDQDEGGLLLRNGRLKRILGPGVYFCLPYFDEIHRYIAAVRTLDLTSQSIFSKDKKSLILSWTCTFKIVDPVKAILTTDSIKDQLRANLSSRLVEYVGGKDYESLKPNLIKNYLLQSHFVAEFVEDWGVELLGFHLRDLGLHRIIRLVQPFELDED